jgi:hypothetical protein
LTGDLIEIDFAGSRIDLGPDENRLEMLVKFLCAAAILAFAPTSSTDAFTQTKFASEDTAHQHCPTDMVVWLTLPGNVFVRKGNPLYGATQRGAYMCERDAIAAGDRGAH